MHTTHRTLLLAGHTLQRIDFDASTLTPADLLWLPHHAQLARFARKRQAEHLAGRIAAVHALHALGERGVPGIGSSRQPLWPAGVFGSISHSGRCALAVASRQPVGIDVEALFSAGLCAELMESIISPPEYAALTQSQLPIRLALTLVFSAKESLFKAFSHLALPFPGFASAQLVALDAQMLTFRLLPTFSPQLAQREARVYWRADNTEVVTLVSGLPCGS